MEYTYTTLAAALESWPSDDDEEYVAEIPSIIKLGEQRLLRELQLGHLDAILTAPFTTGDPVVDKPAGFLVAYDVTVTTQEEGPGDWLGQLTRVQPGFLRAYNATAAQGLPRYFCEESETTWNIGPIPDIDGALVVRCIATPPGLDVDDPEETTWLATEMGDLLLEACLLCAEKFLKDDRRWGMVKTNFDLLLPDAKAQVAQLRRVLPEDQLFKRMITKPENSDAVPQNQ